MTDVRTGPEALADVPPFEQEKVVARVGPVIAVLVVSALIMILNETLLSVALPPIMADFGVTATTAQWLTTGFLLTLAIVIPTTGYLIRRFTSRTLFVSALVLFVIGTALAAFAPSFGVVLAGRVIQASGTAIILPLLMVTTMTSVSPEHRGTVMGLNSVVISVAPAIGPTISGLVVGALDWRWLFILMLPIAAIVLVAGAAVLRTSGETGTAPLDLPSVALSAVAFGGIVYGLATMSDLFDGGLTPVVALVVGIAVLVAFGMRQAALQRTDTALLDLRPFAVPAFRTSAGIIVIAMATMLGSVIVLPIYLQGALQVSVVTTGLVLLPGGLVQGFVSPLVGRIYDRVGPRPIVIPGAILLAAGQWGMSLFDAGTSLGTLIAMHLVFCIGMAMLMTPLMTLSLSSLPRSMYAHGSAIINTLQQLAGAAGTALLIAAMTVGATAAAAASEAAGLVAGTQTAFVLGGRLALVAVVCSLFVRRAEPVRD